MLLAPGSTPHSAGPACSVQGKRLSCSALKLHHLSAGVLNRRQGAATWRWQQHRDGDAHWESGTLTYTARGSLLSLPAGTYNTADSLTGTLRIGFNWQSDWLLLFCFSRFRECSSLSFILDLQSSDWIYCKEIACDRFITTRLGWTWQARDRWQCPALCLSRTDNLLQVTGSTQLQSPLPPGRQRRCPAQVQWCSRLGLSIHRFQSGISKWNLLLSSDWSRLEKLTTGILLKRCWIW